MARFVLDASVTLAWHFEDEAQPYADRVLDRLVQGDTALVPSLWSLEVVNILLVGERRNRPSRESAAFLSDLMDLPVQVLPMGTDRIFSEVIELGRLHSLSSYDAAYLDLAMQMAVPLATADRRLRRAAADAGVEILQ
ncbi:MAG: type II toxin-antitoxin system VapC family toxin [Rhodothermales bacterium]|nr:type II toxin-antitoxin system VapC family toxin [Rhodothermales bacterium]